jgi:hypothetical protein
MTASAHEDRYSVVNRWRLNWPGFITRVRLIDRVGGGSIDLSSAAVAERFLAGLSAEEPMLIVEPRLQHYRAAPLKNGKTWLCRTDSALESYIEGVTRNADLAERLAGILNRVDPATIAPSPPPLPVKTLF